MTSSTATPETDAPIPDALLAAAFTRDRSPFEGAEEPSPEPEAETPPPDGESEPDPEADTTATVETEDAETPPSDAPAPPDTQTDPFVALVKDALPLTYTVDGQQKTYPGVFEVPGKGAVIPAEHLARVRDTFQRAEHAVEQNRKLYAEQQEFVKVGGIERLETVERDFARQNAAGEILVSAFGDPNAIAALLVQKADGSFGFSDRHQLLIDRMNLAAGRAEMDARAGWSTKRTTAQAEVNAPTEQTDALTQAVNELGKDLTPEDRDAAMKFFSPLAGALVRKATAEDVAQWPQFRIGQTLVDAPKMAAWFQTVKAHRENTAKETTARQKAEAENAKRLAQTKAATPPAKPKPKAAPRNDDGTFAEKKKYDREDFLMAARKGLPTPGTTPDD